ncbi:hypothetical protein GE061_016439 [Apolygus lucorum]|uniref:Protein amnionless n=1 Tax=Apolygus lucorum TaxID=248454 RepID=A0A8S9XG09_APOLU|nr:hypothetical protein GE061_016439 [Apolygus lucorum]
MRKSLSPCFLMAADLILLRALPNGEATQTRVLIWKGGVVAIMTARRLPPHSSSQVLGEVYLSGSNSTMISNIVVAVTLALLRSCDSQIVRTWRYNSNFNNPDNWEHHELPCKTSDVIFPRDKDVPVILPTTKTGESIVEVRRIVLPRYGWFIFPRKYGGISLTNEETDASCPGGDVKYVRTGRKNWVDPEGWLSSSEYSSKATPHLERVPCRFDAVKFPDESTFLIALPSRPVTVSSVKIQGQEIKTQSEWRTFMTWYGYKFFITQTVRYSEPLQISGDTCSDSSGCECGNSHLYDEICSDRSKWVDPSCADPVKPIGFCHPICGAYLQFKEGHIREIRDETEKFLKSVDVISHTSKANGFIQIVLMDKNDYTGDIKEFAKMLHKHLIERKLVKYAASTKVEFSGLRTTRVEPRDILEKFFIGLLCAVLGFGIIFCSYEKNWLTRSLDLERLSSIWSGTPSETWGFARFENIHGIVELSEEAVPVIPASAQKSKDTKLEFDNPMFSGHLQSTDGAGTSQFDGRRESLDTIETDSRSTTSDSSSPDELSMKEVNLVPVDR